jgi:hypothetical protein
MSTFREILERSRIDQKDVLAIRHTPRPFEKPLKTRIVEIAGKRPDLFNAYQQTQSRTVEPRMLKAQFVASFIGGPGFLSLFVGLYRNHAATPLTREEYWQIQLNVELGAHGVRGLADDDPRNVILWFDLVLMTFLQDCQGRLVVNWPRPAQQWTRFCDSPKADMPVAGFFASSVLGQTKVDWSEMDPPDAICRRAC